MTESEFQAFVIQQLTALTESQKSLAESQRALTESQRALTESQQTLAAGQLSLIERVDHLGNKIDRLELRMENEAFNKISALFDGYQQNTEVLADHTRRLERIENKLETHDIQIHGLDETKSNKRKVK